MIPASGSRLSSSTQPVCAWNGARITRTASSSRPLPASARPYQKASSRLSGCGQVRRLVLGERALEVAGAGEIVARARARVGAAEPEQPPQLRHRVGVVLHAQVDRPVLARVPLARPATTTMRRRLAPADVAALGPRRRRAPRAAARRRAPPRLGVGADHRRGHGVALHHVRLRAHLLAERVPGVRDAAETGVHRHAPAAVDERHLPDGLTAGRPRSAAGAPRGALALAHQLEPARPERRLGDRLRGHRAHARLAPSSRSSRR